MRAHLSTTKAWTLLLLASVALASPAKVFSQALATVAPAEQVITDIAYKPDATSEYERERCKLDLYLPESAEGFPTLVWFHGGGLQNGHKADDIAVGLAKRFSSEGIAVASVNYRLSPRATFPAYVEDAAAAVAFVREAIDSHGGSPELIFVSGHSAGGYLTAMVGMDPQFIGQHGLTPEDVAGYIPVAGQMVTHSTVRGERGIPRTRPLIDEAAPAYYVRAEAAPFLCIAGSNDLPSRAEENRYFVSAMKAAGHNAVEYLEAAGRDHGTVASKMHETDDLVAQEIKAFILKVQSEQQ